MGPLGWHTQVKAVKSTIKMVKYLRGEMAERSLLQKKNRPGSLGRYSTITGGLGGGIKHNANAHPISDGWDSRVVWVEIEGITK